MRAVKFRIPPELTTQLKEVCKRQNRSADEVICESLRRYLVAEELRELRADTFSAR